MSKAIGPSFTMSETIRIVTTTETISTTKMTGFFDERARVQLAEAVDQSARFTIGGSNSGRARNSVRRALSLRCGGGAHQNRLPLQKVLDDRAEREAGQERQRADDQDHGVEQHAEQRRVGVQRAGALRNGPRAAEAAGERERRDQRDEPDREHHEAAADRVEGPVAVSPANAEPLLFPIERNA